METHSFFPISLHIVEYYYRMRKISASILFLLFMVIDANSEKTCSHRSVGAYIKNFVMVSTQFLEIILSYIKNYIVIYHQKLFLFDNLISCSCNFLDTKTLEINFLTKGLVRVIHQYLESFVCFGNVPQGMYHKRTE